MIIIFDRGQSFYNSSIIGWAGHSANGQTTGNVTAMLEKVTRTFEIEDIVRKVTFITMSNEDVYVTARDHIVLREDIHTEKTYHLWALPELLKPHPVVPQI